MSNNSSPAPISPGTELLREAMQIFVRVAELASFTRAADSLGLPKASVSTAVQQLESALGTRLLHRTTRKVQLTQDGSVFYERSKDLLTDMDDLQAMFQQSLQALRGRLRVDMPSGVARNFVIPRLPEFLQAHPHLELEISSTDRRVDLVREGFDCVLRIGALGDTTLIARPLGRVRLVNCASPAYLSRHGTPQRLEDLAHHQLIHFVTAFGAKSPGWEYPDGTGYRDLLMPGALTVNNAEAYEAACLAGLGPHPGSCGRCATSHRAGIVGGSPAAIPGAANAGVIGVRQSAQSFQASASVHGLDRRDAEAHLDEAM